MLSRIFRNLLIPAVIVCCLLLLGARVYYLQCTPQEDFENRRIRQLRNTTSVKALRGQIRDRNGAILAMSTSSPFLWADPVAVTKKGADPAQIREEAATLVADILEMPRAEILDKLGRSGSRYVVIAKDILDYPEMRLRTAIAQGSLPGFTVGRNQKRIYPKHELFGTQIGLCDETGHGSFGVEAGADYYLSGIDGFSTSLHDLRGGSFLTLECLKMNFPPQNGQDIYLTIDETIQQIAQDALLEVAEKYTPKGAGIIIMDPRSGDILAFASWPFFDPNERSQYQDGIFSNMLLSNPYEPGSIMKTISGAVALNAGVVDLTSEINCENGLWRTDYGRKLKDDHYLGRVSFKDVIKFSSNIGIAKTGDMLGKENLYEGLRAFGFGECCNLRVMPGESRGLLSPPKKWTAYSLNSVPMGQEIGVTAMQLVSAVATIANRGVRMRPRIVKRVEMPDGSMSLEARDFNYFEPEVLNRSVISEKAALDMTDAMVSVTDPDGTGRLAAIPGYKVAGKTGTAQKREEGSRGYSTRNYVASFMGFVPAYEPRLACIVSVDSPRNKIYGGTVAAPVFRKVCAAALEYLQVPPEEEFDEFENTASGTENKEVPDVTD